MSKPQTPAEMEAWLRRDPEVWAEFCALRDKYMSRYGEAMWRCIAMHMEMRAEGTGIATSSIAASAMYRVLCAEIRADSADEMRAGAL